MERKQTDASIAQSVEHSLSKRKVGSSILPWGFLFLAHISVHSLLWIADFGVRYFGLLNSVLVFNHATVREMEFDYILGM